ncbi:MAG: VOC family protein [Acidobacteriota bacterium]|nr:VOC family protein [Acidobacteriota bacterium]
MASLTPFLWLDSDLAEVLAFYRSVFPDMVVHDRQGAGPEGPVFSATIELFGQQIRLFNAGPPPGPLTEAISLMIEVSSQAEIDHLWDRLTSGGGQPGRCGWLKDRFGLSWQIVPDMLGAVLGGGDPARAQQAQAAMMTMTKLDIAALQAAYER